MAGNDYTTAEGSLNKIRQDLVTLVEGDVAGILGAATDTPADVVEGATARSFVSLLKGIKNYLKTLAGAVSGTKILVTADGTVTANQGTASATPWPASDAGPSWTSVWGVSGVPVTSADMSGAAVAVTDAPATAGHKLVITDLLVSSDTDLRLTFTEETSGTVIAYVRLAANSTQQVTFRSKKKLGTADRKLFCQASAAGNVEVLPGYYSEA